MTKIVLVCAAGMSTSLLVEKIKKAAEMKGLDYEVSAHPVAQVVEKASGADVILLGPQVRFQLNKVKDLLPKIPVEAIDMAAYGTMDGDKVIEQVQRMVGK
ncbi:PTS system cellobiose-specific IIB component [Breznakia blatticola]|uniref:PTS system cellobiose-specific IIB component n=1 Tax=Breznakia blatticola TaxID=1754012 RepID=A0A4R7ZFX0_9FIRM|nr:PTS sugar transporter subunit IIB [Breznakia blatticola]TDW16527.1 PTS system cellobiose-specific IIB component [Breznakia blatticola]